MHHGNTNGTKASQKDRPGSVFFQEHILKDQFFPLSCTYLCSDVLTLYTHQEFQV